MAKTYNEIYIRTRRALRDAGIEACDMEARLIVSRAADKTVAQFLRDLPLYAAAGFDETVEAMVERRLAGEPVAYITGGWEFYGVPLDITPDVLIPRPDTEIMVEAAVRLFEGRNGRPRILDLCAGSGCVGCAMAVHMPGSKVIMVDNDRRALSVCRKNVQKNRLDTRVMCIEADATQKPPMLLGKFDLIACNAPYVPTAEIATLDISESTRYDIDNLPVIVTFANSGSILKVKEYTKESIVVPNNKYLTLDENGEILASETSDGVLDGEHKVVVVAIIDGVSQNVADIHTIEVKDQGNVAMENLSIDKVELDVTIYSSGYTVFNYNVYFSWTVPEEASTISQYTLYCDNGGSWVQQQGIYSFNNPGVNFNEMTSNKVSFMRTTFQNNHMDENWQTIYDEGGPDCSFWLTATYESGESPISNIVKLNPYSIAVKSEAYEEYEKTTGINEVDTAPSETERYDLTGRPIRNMRGIVIERQGSEVRKIIRK